MGVGDFPVGGKIIVVTGGGSGIGLSVVKAAVAKGAKALIGDLKLTNAAQEFVQKNPQDVKFAKCDVTKWKDLEDLMMESKKEFGDVPDIYVPAAGIFEPKWSNFWNDEETERYAQLDINLAHPIKLTRLAMRALVGRDKKGVVCCISSIVGLHRSYAAALYSSTKHAIIGFVKSLGMADPTEGVKVVGICPGMVMTPLWTDRPDSPQRKEEYLVTDASSLTPEDIATSIIMLIEEGRYSGGTVFKHDVGDKQVVFPGVAETDLSQMPAEIIHLIKSTTSPIMSMMKAERGISRI